LEKKMTHKVLLVDDELHIVEAIKRVLRKEDYAVLTAGSAEEALGLLAQESVDVVISDEKMSGMCGSEFLALVYQRYPETVRIILTGHADLEVALRAINQGHIYRFLVKPVNDLELKVTIRQAIQHKELIMESRRLLNTVRQQQALFNELEKENPGITRVKRDELGAILLEDAEYDPDKLVEEINREILKWEGSSSNGRKADG
jgi:two-component system, probable response regulator PhcQ